MNIIGELKEIQLNKDGIKSTFIIQKITGEVCEYNATQIHDIYAKNMCFKNCVIEDNDIRYVSDNKRFEDISNDTFNDWTAIEYLGNQKWLCECSCGVRKAVVKSSLRIGKSKSCGHTTNISGDITGKCFGLWTVKSKASNGYWTCECECGTIRDVWKGSLLTGESTSCGHNTNAFQDLADSKIGDWHIKKYVGHGNWLCECICGTVKEVKGAHLRNGSSKSCGHAFNKIKDLTDMQIGLWTVKHKTISNGHNTFYHCVCDCGRERDVNGQSLRTGQSVSCGQCSKTDEQLEIISTAEKFNSTLLNMYIANKGPLSLEVIMKKLNVSLPTLRRLLNKFNSYCYIIEPDAGISTAEKELRNYIETIITCDAKYNTRKVLDNTVAHSMELDIFVPDYNFGIEYNGIYWHSSIHKDAKYHLNKTLACKEKGIKLLHIFEHEYYNDALRPILYSIIKQNLGLSQNKIYARQTIVKQPTIDEVRKFLNENHLQGYINYNKALGLYYNGVLVELMTFGKPRYNSLYEEELLRLCTKLDYTVIGGAQKLFKHYLKENNTKSIVSYCDISKFTGEVYEKLGMQFDGYTSVSYTYVNSHLHELNRMSCTKSILLSNGWGTEEQTEEEIMRSRGYYKIYGCGNARYIYKRA